MIISKNDDASVGLHPRLLVLIWVLALELMLEAAGRSIEGS